MARVLVHYDIADSEFREKFQNTITDPSFNQRFTKETESVYCARFSTTLGNVAALVKALKQAAAGAPAGTRILMEHPTTYSGCPEIEQTPIA
jgi:hypothetical protein